MSHLRPCSSCERHVLSTSGVCPFCGATLATESRAAIDMPHLGRAALIAFAASVAACHDDTPQRPPVPQPEPTAQATASATTAAPSATPSTAPSAMPSTLPSATAV